MPAGFPELSLVEITKDNWKAVAQLEVKENQQNFVAPNIKSLAEAQFYEGTMFRGIANAEELIGFVLLSLDPDDPKKGHIVRYMIDHKFQGQGLGKLGLLKVIQFLSQDLGRSIITLTVVPENEIARKLYTTVGFVNTEEIVEGELKYKLAL